MLSLKDVGVARKLIGNLVERTPLIFSQYFSRLCNGEVFLKLENRQITNSFKIRGVFNKMLNLSLNQRKRGVVTASTGNHAQAVAIAAEKLGIPARIVVPCNTPKIKIGRIKQYNVELQVVGEIYDEAEQAAIELAERERMIYISPYNDRFVIAGQGTIALEILEDLDDLNTIVVPVGGGGLISGIGLAVKSVKPEIEIVGVQSVASPVMYESLKAGKIVTMTVAESIADGLHGGIESHSITFGMVQDHVDGILLVEEATIQKAIYLLAEKENQIVEGAGATPIALLLEHRELFKEKRVVAILSGGNIEEEQLSNILSSEHT
ncbi:MAG: pyridoxal-phosphate dependent enzyme [Candidatus Bathyarchaeota archaeon]|nr:pyridoxal-phosphate dependent enzyme [Candidatus Bathyarchaeota archaeon]